ncbi:MAG: hypothetical protein AAGF79_16315 [Pseudomonadota bacterium]
MALVGFLNLLDLPGDVETVQETVDTNEAFLNDEAETMLVGLAGQETVDSFDFLTVTNIPEEEEGPAATLNFSLVDYVPQVGGQGIFAFLEALSTAQAYDAALEEAGLEEVYAIPVRDGEDGFDIAVIDIVPLEEEVEEPAPASIFDFFG